MIFQKHLLLPRLPGLFLGLVVILFSCSKNQVNSTEEVDSKLPIQTLINEGVLLNSISESGLDYIFHFETKELKAPKAEIEDIKPEPESWTTAVFFVDGSQLIIPSKGSSLDFIVKRINVNPSGYNPLAALVEVELPTFGRIKVTVHGKNGDQGTITHLCQTETPHQEVPILGLYADYKNIVDITYTDKNGQERGTTQIAIETEALPTQDFPQIQVIKAQLKNMEPGINLVNYPGASFLDVSMPYMVDSEGEIRWILLFKSSPDLNSISISSALKRTKDGTLLAGDQHDDRIVEFDMFGNLLNQWDLKHLGYTFHHDITEAVNGNYLITVTKTSARLTNGQPRVKDHIIEVNPASGALVNEWDLAELADTSRYLKPDSITPPQFSQSPGNWAHNNSIIEFDNGLLATMRYQGIISFTRAGEIKWIISPHKYWREKYRPYLLNPVDNNGSPITDTVVINGDASTEGFDWSWGPHTPEALSDDRILVFDNGYNRHWVSNFLTQGQNYSRVVEYKINKDDKTVQQVWAYGKSRGPECFSPAISGVQYLPQTGNILFCPGMAVPTRKGLGGRVVEIDPLTKEVIFEMEITTPSNTAFHRVTRMPLYPDNF